MTRSPRGWPTWLVGILTVPLLVLGVPAADAAPTPTCFGEPATVVVRHTASDVVGTDGPDVMVVTGRTPTVYGGAGGDRICTNGDIVGGRGHDWLLGFRRTNVVRLITLGGGPGDDHIFRRGPRDGDPHLSPLMRGGSGDDRLDGGTNLDRLVGGRGRDRLLGGALGDRLWGGPGADLLLGETGRDEMSGGQRGDRLVGGGGRDVADGGLGDDRCDAEVESDC